MQNKTDNKKTIKSLIDKTYELGNQNILLQMECKRLQVELDRRMKELDSIYQLCLLPGDKNVTLKEYLAKVLNIIQYSYPNHEKISIRITLGNNHYHSEHFIVSDWKQSQIIFIDGQAAGLIEVFYHGSDRDFEIIQNSLPRENQNLLMLFAERIGSEKTVGI
jgi:hypothetical protein